MVDAVDTSGLTLVTQAAVARLIGVSRQAIGKAVASGRLSTFGPRKLVDAASARQQLAGATSRVNVLDDEDEDDDDLPTLSSAPSLTQLKARTEEERHLKLRLDRLELEGLLVPRDQVEEEHEAASRLIRKALDTIPSHAEDIASAAQSGGALAVRKALKKLVRDVEEVMAKAMIEAADEMEAQRRSEAETESAEA